MMRQRLWLALLVLSATLTQCSKCKENIEPSLPPETQVGAGTFACRINGVVWQYKNPTGLNLFERTNWRYDPNEMKGTLSISGYRYDNNDNGLDQLGLRVDSLSLNKIAFIDSISQRLFVGYFNYQKLKPNECTDYLTHHVVNDPTKQYYRQGKLEVTKLDISARIISGRFECMISQKGCDTLKITEGRFDLKF